MGDTCTGIVHSNFFFLSKAYFAFESTIGVIKICFFMKCMFYCNLSSNFLDYTQVIRKSHTFFASLNALSAHTGVPKGAILRHVLPFDENTSSNDQSKGRVRWVFFICLCVFVSFQTSKTFCIYSPAYFLHSTHITTKLLLNCFLHFSFYSPRGYTVGTGNATATVTPAALVGHEENLQILAHRFAKHGNCTIHFPGPILRTQFLNLTSSFFTFLLIVELLSYVVLFE